MRGTEGASGRVRLTTRRTNRFWEGAGETRFGGDRKGRAWHGMPTNLRNKTGGSRGGGECAGIFVGRETVDT